MITESDLENAARTLYDVCFKLQQNEKILIVDDSWQPKLIATLEKIAKEKGVVKRIKIRKERVDSSPIPEIKEELEKVDVVVAATRYSITHSPETVAAVKKGARVASMPAITENMFMEAMDSNLDEMKTKAQMLEKILKGNHKIRTTCPLGTDLKLKILEERPIILDDSDLSKKGTVRNVPSGEVMFAPLENSANGRVVFSYSAETEGPARLDLEEGTIVCWDEKAQPVLDVLDKYEGGKRIAEFAIGINKRITPVKFNSLATEKGWGSIHVAFGENRSIGGKNQSEIHKDVIVMNPSVWVDDENIIKDGEFIAK